MAALTEARNTFERIPSQRQFTAEAQIYAGGLVAVNASGKAVPAADAVGLTVVGRAEHNAAPGGLINVRSGCFRYDNGSAAVSRQHLGSDCYVEDDQTVSTAGGSNNIVAGKVFDVDDNGVWIII